MNEQQESNHTDDAMNKLADSTYWPISEARNHLALADALTAEVERRKRVEVALRDIEVDADGLHRKYHKAFEIGENDYQRGELYGRRIVAALIAVALADPDDSEKGASS